MTLKVVDAVTNDPARDDIVRAVDRATQGRLALDNGQDDHIEAVAAGTAHSKIKCQIGDCIFDKLNGRSEINHLVSAKLA